MTVDTQVYNPILYELAALGRDEPAHTIIGETRQEILESLLVALNGMDDSKAIQLGENNVK